MKKKLGKFQQFVKNEDVERDLNFVECSNFMKLIKKHCTEDHIELVDDIAGSLDMLEVIEEVLEQSSLVAILNVKIEIRDKVRQKIKETLEEIEDIEEVNKMDDDRADQAYEEQRQREIDEEL
tara:strand:- start:635 stop:1003 length:369 start_codon:yes stop_codon:yes gene_type:complete